MAVQEAVHPGAQGLLQPVAGAFQGLAHGGHGGVQRLTPGRQARFQLLDGGKSPGQEVPGEFQLLPEAPGHHLHLGQAAPGQAAGPQIPQRGFQVCLEPGRFRLRKGGGVRVQGPHLEDRGFPGVQALAPGLAAVQEQLQGGKGIDPGVRLPGGQLLGHPVPDLHHLRIRAVLPQIQVEEGQDMGHQPHSFQLRQKLEIRLAQPHPGTDDVKHQVALDEIGQDLGQVLGEGRVAPLAVSQLHARGRPGKGDGEQDILEVHRGGLPGDQVPVPGQVRTGEGQHPGGGHEALEKIVALQVGLEQQVVLVQAAPGPEVGLPGLGQDLGQEFPVRGLLQVQRLGPVHQPGIGQEPQGPADFPVDFVPTLEPEHRPGFRAGLDPGDHGRENPGAPAQQVLAHQGVDHGALAGFHRAHHRQAAGVLRHMGLDLGQHLLPVLALDRGLGKKTGPLPGQILKPDDLLHQGLMGLRLRHVKVPGRGG